MNTITYSAPAKIILSGEHAVVYGKPALAMAIDKTVAVSISPKQGTHDQILPSIAQTIITEVTRYIQHSSLPLFNEPWHYTIHSNIPTGRGLGSSAAVAVAGSASLFHFLTQRAPTKDEVNSIAYAVEKHIHKTPSGVDNSVATFGGLIYYRKEFEFLKTISALTIQMPLSIQDHLFLVDTGKPVESTGEMVAKVGNQYNLNAEHMEALFQHNEKLTKRMVVAIMKEDVHFFRKALAEHHDILVQYGIVSDHTADVIERLKPYGVGKITGAGGHKKGSGYVLFYADNPTAFVLKAQELSLSYFPVRKNNQGVCKQLR